RGAIRYANGDGYNGDFVAGAPHGQGRYAATDGSVFEGAFQNGERHGAGMLSLPDGTIFRVAFDNGRETARTQIGGEIKVAQAAPRVTLKAYTDRQRNQQFAKGDDVFRSFVYDQETTPNGIRIRLSSKELLDAWKGNAPLPEQFKLFEDA